MQGHTYKLIALKKIIKINEMGWICSWMNTIKKPALSFKYLLLITSFNKEFQFNHMMICISVFIFNFFIKNIFSRNLFLSEITKFWLICRILVFTKYSCFENTILHVNEYKFFPTGSVLARIPKRTIIYDPLYALSQ